MNKNKASRHEIWLLAILLKSCGGRTLCSALRSDVGPWEGVYDINKALKQLQPGAVLQATDTNPAATP